MDDFRSVLMALELKLNLLGSSSKEAKLKELLGTLRVMNEFPAPPASSRSQSAAGAEHHAAVVASGKRLAALARLHGVSEEFNREIQAKRDRPFGSGIDGADLTVVKCAYQIVREEFACNNAGSYVCGRCKLVAYCSPEHQRLHYEVHKQDCKHTVASPAWQPRWLRTGRPCPFFSNQT